MTHRSRQASLLLFRTIPGVGKSISEDLWNIGIRSFEDIKKTSPDALYERMCVQQRTRIDRCMLYVLRCACYFVSHKNHDPEKLQWWHWKD